jgi:putative DNA primase/helicase
MITADEIAEHYDLTQSGDSYTGDCPCCGYRGFSLTERDGRVLVYCHAGGCGQEEIIEVLREADLWVTPVAEHLFFPPLDDEPPKAGQEPAQNAPKSSAGALAMWRRSSPAAGTSVETYLRVRGYRGPLPASLRYVTGKHPSDDALHPVMVAAVIRPDRPPGIIGVHRTFLLPDGSAKAGFDPDKMSLGPVGGGGVPLATPGPKIAVSEGIETGLSFMQATGIPTWAALSAGGIKKLLLPPDVREVLIAADADLAGISAARIAAQRWHAEGRKVRIVKPPERLDFNDLARAS